MMRQRCTTFVSLWMSLLLSCPIFVAPIEVHLTSASHPSSQQEDRRWPPSNNGKKLPFASFSDGIGIWRAPVRNKSLSHAKLWMVIMPCNIVQEEYFNTRNVEYMQKRFQEVGGQSALVYTATSNFVLKSYSGIDICGSRLAAEVRDLFEGRSDLADVRRVSFVGHSAGGLFVRYAIGVLFEEGFFSERGIALDKVITAASPHLGVRSSPRGVMGRMKNRTLETLGNLYGGLTLDQMTLTDKGPGGSPLLLHMSLPGTRYSKALGASDGVYFYANPRRDNTVSYCTAGVARRNPYRENENVTFIEGFRYIAGVSRVSEDADLVHEREVQGIPDARDSATPSGVRGPNPDPGYTWEQSGEMKVVNGGPRAAAGVAAISPLLVAHFVGVALPMRAAYAMTVGKDDPDAKGKCSENNVGRPAESGATEPQGSGLEEGNGNDGYTPEVVDRRRGGRGGRAWSVASLRRRKDKGPSGLSSDQGIDGGRLVRGVPSGSSDKRAGFAQSVGGSINGDQEMDDSEDAVELELDSVPAVIRRNLGRPELGINRVEVYLPSFHTHGTIIVRRSAINDDGSVVIEHMAKLLFD